MILGRPPGLVRVEDHELLLAPGEGVLGRLRGAGLVGLGRVRAPGQEVAAELGPAAAHGRGREPVVELGRVLEGEELEDEPLVLGREVAEGGGRGRARGGGAGAGGESWGRGSHGWLAEGLLREKLRGGELGVMMMMMMRARGG